MWIIHSLPFPFFAQIFKEAKNRLESAGNPAAADLELDLGLVYRYVPSYCQYRNNKEKLQFIAR